MVPRVPAVLASIVALAACVQAQPPAARSAAAVRPTLVVFVTVDQLRPDYYGRYERQLTGGLKRLYAGGAVFDNGYQDHAITETAPGHSTTMSGRFPRSTGIISNGRGVGDPGAPLIGGGGEGASPRRFRGTTLIDWIRASTPASRALSVSRKDRGAILPIGTQRHDVYWYASDGRFTTSSYYRDTLPAWVQRFNERKLAQRYAGRTWDLLLPASQYPEPDSVDLENAGQQSTFPHPFPADSESAASFMIRFPPMDSLTLQFALAGLEALQLGRGPHTDVLAVSLSTTDAVGHAFGPESREIHDQVLRVDRYLGAFLDSLYKLRDSSRIIVALTSDHGVAPLPEIRARMTGEMPVYVDIRPALADLRRLLTERAVPRTAFRIEDEIVYADRSALAGLKIDADSLLDALAATLRKTPGVLRVDRVRALARQDTAKDYVARRWIHMLPPDPAAELVVTLVPYAYYEGAVNATHGTPHDYDARVPVILYGPAVKRGRYPQSVRVVDLAPTLAHIAGVKPLEKLDGHVLTVALP